MSKVHTALAPFLMLSLGLLGSCSPITPPKATSAVLNAQGKEENTNLPKNYKYLHTLTITSSVTQAELQSLYGGYIVSYRPDQGSAIVANNSSTKGKYDNAIPEANGSKFKTGEQGVGVWSSGFGTWSSGYGTWATGYGTWATGTTTAATTFQDNVPLWNAINLSQAQTLVPELGKGVKVAVIDTGIDLAHPAFQGKLDLAGARDYLDGDSSPQEVNTSTTGSYSDGYGHGTAVADIVLQVAPNATILPIRVLDPSGNGSTASIAAAINYAADMGAKVINLSLGSSTPTSSINKAIQDVISRGVAVVSAAGNTGKNSVLYPAVNADTSSDQGLGSVGVGSINTSYLKSSFSSYGSMLELEAPGENIMTAFPGGLVVKATGTSFSTPVVSGVLALALSTGLTGTVQTMMTNLDTTARAPSDPAYRSFELGYGSVDAYAFIHKYR